MLKFCFKLLVLLSVLSIAHAQSVCDDEQYQIFNSLSGIWNEIDLGDPDNIQIRIFESRKVSAGCAVQHTFTSASVTTNSFLYLDSDGIWKEIVVDNKGELNKYQWLQLEEEFIIDKVHIAGPNKQRFVISDISDQEYLLSDERSSNWGQSWSLHTQFRRIRINEHDNEKDNLNN